MERRVQGQRVKVTYVVTKGFNFNKVFFPGVIFHELAHFIACILMGSRVTHTRFWDAKEAAVTHEELSGLRGYAISSAPFLFGTLAALLFIRLGQYGARHLATVSLPELAQVLLLYYLGMSIAYHAFPSKKDASNALHALTSFYGRKIGMRDGLFQGMFWLATAPFIFLPLYVAGMVMSAFSRVRHLGLLWFIVLFFANAYYL